MTNFFSQWLHKPNSAKTRLIVFTELCGYAYGFIGATFFFLPHLQVQMGMLPPYQGQEEGMVRLLGLTLGIIGYFYVFGARTHARSFCLSTVVDRLLVPFLLAFVFLVSDVALMLILPLAVLDPLLAITALFLWYKEERG
ncbi:MAG: hypothetical protein VX278_04040 [Myxococcota bacterium]|nr:hypothetical protein [Myxococcota bacterium]